MWVVEAHSIKRTKYNILCSFVAQSLKPVGSKFVAVRFLCENSQVFRSLAAVHVDKKGKGTVFIFEKCSKSRL